MAEGAAGGTPAHAGRPGRASFSTGPSSRTKAEGAAGAGPFASGAPGAAALALIAAAALLAPGEARAGAECGFGNSMNLTCAVRDFPNGIVYGIAGDGNDWTAGSGQTFNLPGSATTPVTITAGALGVGLGGETTATGGLTINVGGATGGTAHVVNFVQGTNAHTGIDRNNGIYVHQDSNQPGVRLALNVRAGVTIGTMATPMKRHGISLRARPTSPSQGRGAPGITLTSAATIYAARQGIRVIREIGGTNDPTTITNSGDIYSGVGNPSATGAYSDRPHGIYHLQGGTGPDFTGSVVVVNSGDITLGGAYTGILLNKWGAGVMSLDNSGDIAAVAGQTARQGIQFNYNYWDNRSTADVTLTNSGDITASEFGIRLKKLSGGDIELTNRGAITVTGDAAQHLGHAIYLADNFIVGAGRTYAQSGHGIAAGDVTIVTKAPCARRTTPSTPSSPPRRRTRTTSSSPTAAPSPRRKGTASASSGPTARAI